VETDAACPERSRRVRPAEARRKRARKPALRKVEGSKHPYPRRMTLTVVAVIFGVFASALIVLLIYNSTLTMRRDDQLFLDDASSHMHADQTELLAKVNRLTIPVRVSSIGSAVFVLVFVAMWLYQKLNGVQQRRKRRLAPSCQHPLPPQGEANLDHSARKIAIPLFAGF
jgi:hypothetical protein